MAKHDNGDERRSEHGGGHWDGIERRSCECIAHPYIMKACQENKAEVEEDIRCLYDFTRTLAESKMSWGHFWTILGAAIVILGSGFAFSFHTIERISGALENVSKIQAGVLIELNHLQKYDELDRLEKARGVK